MYGVGEGSIVSVTCIFCSIVGKNRTMFKEFVSILLLIL